LNALNESASRRGPVRFIYRFRRSDQEGTALEASGHAHVSHDPIPTWPSQRHVVCRGFFMMARPYLTNDRTLFDFFLEFKIENERLLARKAELEYEEAADQAAEGEEWTLTGSGLVTTHLEARICMDNSPADSDRMAPPQMMSIASDTAPTQRLSQKLADNEISSMELSSQKVDMGDPDHRKAQRIWKSCTNCSFTGDVCIQISVHGSNRKRAAKTKMKNSQTKQHLQSFKSYMCMHCSTMVSPE
jgi:hypothetical protein